MVAGDSPSGIGRSIGLGGMLLLTVGHGLAFMDRHVLAVAAPLLKADMILSDAGLGLLLGPAFVLLYAAGLLLSRRLWLKPRRGRWLAGCAVLWTVGMAAMGFAPDFSVLLAGRALVGLGQAAFVPLALGLIVEATHEAARGRAMAGFTSGSVVGRCLGLMIGGAILAGLAAWAPTAWAHWRWLLLLCCLPNMILALMLLRMDRNPPTTGAAPPPPSMAPIVRWMGRRFFLMAAYLTATACGVLVIQMVGAWAPTLLHRDHGLSAAAAGAAFGLLLMATAPIGHFAAGVLIDRPARGIGPTEIGAAALAVTAGLLWLLPLAGGAASILALLALISAVSALAAVAALAGLAALTPGGMKADAVRLCLVVTTLAGVGLGPWAAGLLSDLSGDLAQSLKWVGSSAAGLGALAFLTCVAGWRRLADEGARGP